MLAYLLVLLIILIALALIILTANGDLGLEATKDLAATILTPILAVTGTVFGFYYGGNR